MPEATDMPEEPRLNWPARCVRWCQTTIDGIARELVSKHLAPCKDILLSTTCGGSFFEQLVQEFHRLDHYPTTKAPPAPNAAGAPAAGEAAQAAADAPAVCPATDEYKAMARSAFEEAGAKYRAGKATWDDFHALRKLLLPMYPREELFGAMITLRKAFEDQVSKTQMDSYQKMAPDALGPQTSYAQVLAHALYLQEQVAKVETYRPHQELKRSYITFALFVSLAATVFVEAAGSWGLMTYYSHHDRNAAMGVSAPDLFPFVTLVMVLGALGATVSYQQRLQQSFDQDGSILNTTRYVGTGVGVKVTPLQGSVFAFILLCICYSNLINEVAAGVLPKRVGDNGAAMTGQAAPKATPAPQTGQTAPKAGTAHEEAAAGVLPKKVDVNGVAITDGDNNLKQPDVDKAPKATPAPPTGQAAPEAGAAQEGALPGKPAGGKNEGPEGVGATGNDRTADDNIVIYRDQWRRMIVQLFLIGPRDGVEFAKLLVFAFLAGFAERLVPDTLDRLTMNTRKDKS